MPADSPAADPLAIARALIRCESVTPAEGGALAYLEALLSAHGFACWRPVFSEPGTPDVENLYARIGKGAPTLVFAGHTDVVPPGDPARWHRPPFAAEVDDCVLYGRGAVDMKGAIACFAAAAIAHVRESGSDRGSIAFLITGDEEGPALNGTRKLLPWAHERGERFDAALVGEPTNPQAIGDAIKVGRRGSLSGTVTVEGVQGHVAYPEVARNPVPGVIAVAGALTSAHLDGGTERFQPSNLEITSVDVGNTAYNVIPARARLAFNIRFNDRHTPQSLRARVKEAVADALRDTGLQGDVAFEPNPSEAFCTESRALVAAIREAVEAETGRVPETATGGGTSDARYIKDYCPVVEFGLVGQTMHQVDERVPVADLVRLTAIYRRFLGAFLG